jgi:hypothetical protein
MLPWPLSLRHDFCLTHECHPQKNYYIIGQTRQCMKKKSKYNRTLPFWIHSVMVSNISILSYLNINPVMTDKTITAFYERKSYFKSGRVCVCVCVRARSRLCVSLTCFTRRANLIVRHVNIRSKTFLQSNLKSFSK